MELRIVDAQPRHLSDLEELEQACFADPWTREQLAAELPDERHEFLVAEDENGRAVGYVSMMTVLDEGDIANVAVGEAYRQQGIADRLLEAMLSRAAQRALAFVTLEVREGNEPAIGLYEKHGFVRVGRRKNYYLRPKEDAVLMTKYLKEAHA